ncbi:MAG TPA: class I SAM-dependent methyltransferase [Candidatus Latescibacteria bacterium]|nr:class I SAM-dependent methyltransferase [Candidatus Latescibacterota bacterium]
MYVQKAPYEAIASIYDFLMRHVDYRRWVGYLKALWTRFDPGRPDICELACGTGNIALELWRRGHRISAASDASEAMLARAREKARRVGAEISFVRADLRDLSPLGKFKVLLCVYDSINYLPEGEFPEALRQAYMHLSPGGLFIFDICTEANSMKYFLDYTEVESGPGFSYERRSRYEPEERVQYTYFKVRLAGDPRIYCETHRQWIYPVEWVVERIGESPFELLGAFSDFTFKGVRGGEANRVHFVLRKEGRWR